MSHHLVGIGGIGMSAIARILLYRGVHVTGSDVRATPLIERLQAEGAQITIGHRAENVERSERVIVSSAIDKGNPEIVRARELGIPIVTRGEMLADLTRGKKTIAVAGTHGKTTTTAMIGAVLTAGGVDPTVFVGGELLDSNTNVRVGAGPWFVAESDESDGSFLRLDPYVAVITNIENDHVSDDTEFHRLRQSFESFAAKVPSEGLRVLGLDDRNIAALIHDRKQTPFLSFAVQVAEADLRATIEKFEDFGTQSAITLHGKKIGDLRLNVPGEINVQNALAAIGVGMFVGIDNRTISAALQDFRGVRRRFEVLLRTPELTVVNDYAHHPTAVRATIAVARRYHGGPLIVAFEPHRYTRTRYLAQDFAKALAGADHVILAPVYAASEPPISGVSAASIGEPLRASGTSVEYIDDVAKLPERLRTAPAGSLVLMLGAGAISESAHRLAESAPTEAPVR